MTKDQETLELVQGIFADLSRGKTSSLLDRCADDIELYVGGPPEVPFGGLNKGRRWVEKFLREAMTDIVETTEFQAREYIVSGENIVILGHALCRVRANGARYRNEWACVLTLRDGRFVRMREYFNSAVIVYALRGETGKLDEST